MTNKINVNVVKQKKNKVLIGSHKAYLYYGTELIGQIGFTSYGYSEECGINFYFNNKVVGHLSPDMLGDINLED